jgi:hypothetical protein
VNTDLDEFIPRCKLNKVDTYRERLRRLDDWEPYLRAESGLPGPRGNIELGRAVAEEGNAELFDKLLSWDANKAPTNSTGEFLAFCGALGLGKFLAEGRTEALEKLRLCANDPRWRVREATAMALQRWGRVDMDAMFAEMGKWAQGSMLEQRAAAAALCEPDLLRVADNVERVLQILDRITTALTLNPDKNNSDYKTLRQGLGYCWSVAVAAYPECGKPYMERWFNCDDSDVRWIMKENLKKKRLERMDPEWTAVWRTKLV